MSRLNGSTFRACCEALLTASNGANVVVIGKSKGACNYALFKCADMAAAYGIQFKTDKRRHSLDINQGGVIRFLIDEPDSKVKPKIIYDN